MSACSFCCSFTRWFRLFLFNRFFFFDGGSGGGGGGGCFELLVQGVVLHLLHLFCMDQKSGLSSAFKWFNSSGLLHFSYGSGFHGTKDCPQADFLNFVQFVGMRLDCCRPGAGPIFQRRPDSSHVDGL